MASDTNIKTSERKTRRRRERRGSSLTLRILAVNVLALVVLLLGILYMSQYRENLIHAELETLRVQAQLYAGAVSEGAVRPVSNGRPFLFARPQELEALIPELSRRMVRRLANNSDDRTRLFNAKGQLIGDSSRVITEGGSITIKVSQKQSGLSQIFRDLAHKAISLIPSRTHLATFPETTSFSIRDYPDAGRALKGLISSTAWAGPEGTVILTAAAPVMKVNQVMGVVLITREGTSIEKAMAELRVDVLTVFVGALCLTIFLSLFLAGTIARPLTKLARAAEKVRTGKGRSINIPYLENRHDEIGDLAAALHEMTSALWDRMDSIERFAADVAHEIKNPLTSVRSAVETASIVKDPEKRDKLMDIILHDVKRLDRLITDISNASRVDAELSRDEMAAVDLGILLNQIADAKRPPLKRAGDDHESEPVQILVEQEGEANVLGNQGRLAQVFDNLLSNALSFSPPSGKVFVRLQNIEEGGKKFVRVYVDDEGPGIPEAKLAAIFDRFYTMRPKHEGFGTHSGLGLSIARQIVVAHKGRIWAENRDQGARFVVELPT